MKKIYTFDCSLKAAFSVEAESGKEAEHIVTAILGHAFIVAESTGCKAVAKGKAIQGEAFMVGELNFNGDRPA